MRPSWIPGEENSLSLSNVPSLPPPLYFLCPGYLDFPLLSMRARWLNYIGPLLSRRSLNHSVLLLPFPWSLQLMIRPSHTPRTPPNLTLQKLQWTSPPLRLFFRVPVSLCLKNFSRFFCPFTCCLGWPQYSHDFPLPCAFISCFAMNYFLRLPHAPFPPQGWGFPVPFLVDPIRFKHSLALFWLENFLHQWMKPGPSKIDVFRSFFRGFLLFTAVPVFRLVSGVGNVLLPLCNVHAFTNFFSYGVNFEVCFCDVFSG